MLHEIYNKNCLILKDLLVNCAKKSSTLDECKLLKFNYNKFCVKKYNIIKSCK